MQRNPTLLLFLLLCTCVRAQTNAHDGERLALRAYLTADPALWQQAITKAKAVPDDRLRLLTLAEYQYGLASVTMGRDGQEKTFDDALDALDDAIDEYWELDDENATVHGLYSALLGFKIARKPMMGWSTDRAPPSMPNKL